MNFVQLFKGEKLYSFVFVFIFYINKLLREREIFILLFFKPTNVERQAQGLIVFHLCNIFLFMYTLFGRSTDTTFKSISTAPQILPNFLSFPWVST